VVSGAGPLAMAQRGFAQRARANDHAYVTDDAATRGSEDRDGQLLAFCVVANVAAETAHGEDGLDIRRGIKHFTAGAKVWVLPIQWGDGGEKLIVVGRHRGSAGPYIRMVISRAHLTNLRVRPIYSPRLLHMLTKPYRHDQDRGPELWQSHEEAEEFVRRWRPLLPARFDDDPFSAQVADPPPLELERNGKTYYMAHFNARRATYSTQPPPEEPPATAVTPT
jgi:hypothetical protein